MDVPVQFNGKQYTWNANNFVSIAIPFVTGDNHVNAWYAKPIQKTPFQDGDFIGSVKAGAAVNFFDLSINPHGNGTHTECLGHITLEHDSLKDIKVPPLQIAQLITVQPKKSGEDQVIQLDQIASVFKPGVQALIIRTLPNDTKKLNFQYSHTNPPYLDVQVAQFLVDQGVEHLLVDMPSIDKEVDGGELLAHHVFWGIHTQKRHNATITEMIYAPNEVKDGLFILNLQFLPIENDASPSNPVLFPLKENNS